VPRVISIIDLGVQNILSVENAFRVIGADVRVVKDAAQVADAEFLVLPGVGSFGAAAARLEATGLMSAVRRHAKERKLPLVGLCLGMQLMAESSEEHGVHEGLGLIPGKVVRLEEAPPQFRVPNIGWRTVSLQGTSTLLPRALDGRSYYHVHSFHLRCTDPSDVAGVSRFGGDHIASIVHRGNVFGTQFHPEKSQDAGLDLLHAVWNELR
jgi:imidazole glycerol-phosphate synthase subunit HisH